MIRKLLILLSLFYKNIISDIDYQNDLKCKTPLLQYYAFEGVIIPQDYTQIKTQLNNDYCPKIKHSCCTRQDYVKIERQWDEKARNIRKYITKIFRSIQKITVLQSSLLQLANDVRKKDTDRCREVDFTFFNSPMKYKEVFFYLENSLEAFAFLQKGYYCMLCDAEQHQYLALQFGFTRRVNQMSHKMCNDLIFFFREFLVFKVFFLDPLMVNTNLLFNCYEDTDIYKYNLFYEANFASIKNCLEKGEECEFVCKEFRFGTTSNLFIGKLQEYYEFIQQIQTVLQKFKPELEIDENNTDDEMYLQQQQYPSEFFLDQEQDLDLSNNFILNNYNMTEVQINVYEDGINLFETAINSHYFLVNSMNVKTAKENYGLNQVGEDNYKNGGTALDNYSFEQSHIPKLLNQERLQELEEEEIINKQREQKKLLENPNIPNTNDLISLAQEEEKISRKYDKELRDFAKNKDDLREDVDFGAAGKISKNEILQKISILLILIGIVQFN